MSTCHLLTLIPLDEIGLNALLEKKGTLVLQESAYDFSCAEISEPLEKAIRMKLQLLGGLQDKLFLWMTYWAIIHQETKQALGLIGFKGLDPMGWVEIGYGIFSSFAKRGYMTSAVSMMIKWAFQHEECEAITAIGVSCSNAPSIRVLEKNGFTLTRNDGYTADFLLTKPIVSVSHIKGE